MKILQLPFATVFAIAAIATVGCGVSYGDVENPPASSYSPAMFGDASPDQAYTPATFVRFFNAEMRQNKFRVEDWPGTQVFRFRLPNVEVGDGTVTYSSKGFLPDGQRSLKVICSFANAAESRGINNGDTVDVEGVVADWKRRTTRIIVVLERCYRIQYER